MGDGFVLQGFNDSKNKTNNKKKKKKRGGGSKKKMTIEQIIAFKSVREWVFLDHSSPSDSLCLEDDGFGVQKKVVFELHSHSKFSDGFLSSSKLVEKAHGNGDCRQWDCPGRLHVARALVEAGFVENLKQAFARYLFDGGPAYST